MHIRNMPYASSRQTHNQDISDQEVTNSGMSSRSIQNDTIASPNVTNSPQRSPSRFINTAADHEHKLSLAEMAHPTAGSLEGTSEEPSTIIDMKPYQKLEQDYRSLFMAAGIESTYRKPEMCWM